MRGRFVFFRNLWRPWLGYLLFALMVAPHPAKAAPAPLVIDWSRGDVQDTQANCGEILFRNMRDRQSYALLVRGTELATCSFRADGLRFHLPADFGPTTQGAMTILHFLRIGADVIVTWQPGY